MHTSHLNLSNGQTYGDNFCHMTYFAQLEIGIYTLLFQDFILFYVFDIIRGISIIISSCKFTLYLLNTFCKSQFTLLASHHMEKVILTPGNII